MRANIKTITILTINLSSLGAASLTAGAQTAEPATEAAPAVEKPAPYDDSLMRISEILGSVHYLRNLCKGGEEEWRDSMQKLIDVETENEPQRKSRLTAAFNRGYRSFASVYTRCTPQAVAAEEKYRAEGATLSAEIVARFGN